jgi:hypothetical protein
VGNDSIVDTHIISFNQKNELVKEFSRYLKDVTVQASSLLPMLVKANNLIASWILKYPQQSMSRMFEEMIKNTLENEWLWEDPKFDLLSTERYIEAIGDFYDYYDVYERTYVQKAQDENAKKINRKAEIAQLAEKRAEVKLKEERKILEKSIREEIENSIRSEYILENALIELIDKKVKEKSEQIVVSKLYELFNGAIDYKKATDKADVDLTEEQKSFSDLLSKYVESYLFDEDDVNAAIDDYGVSERIIKVGTFEDLAEFRKTYLAFIAKHHKQIGDKTTLSKIFDLIDKKDK